MVTVVSPQLLAAGAAWDDGPGAGDWIASRLGPFGPSVGHAVPLGYAAYVIVPIPINDAEDESECIPALAALLDLLDGFTGDQPVHSGIWEGWGWLYDTGDDPRTAPGMGAGVFWDEADEPPTQEELARARAEAREQMAAERAERPDAEPLELTHRSYYLWTGPLRSVAAFRDQPQNPPSLVWPSDRSWFVGLPIYTNEIAIAGTTDLIDAVLTAPRLNARPATPDDVLDIDD